jgi:hypothetical protein
MLVKHGKGIEEKKLKKWGGRWEFYAGTKMQTSTFDLCKLLVLCLVL